MKYLLMMTLFLLACSLKLKFPAAKIANPASVYCQEKGGILISTKTRQGIHSDCKLPNGIIIDEWKLFRSKLSDKSQKICKDSISLYKK